MQKKFARLTSATLLSDRIGLAEVFPLKIDSTELIARAIRWATAEAEWPKFPLRKSIAGWSKIWPELTSRDGIEASGQDLLFNQAPSQSLLAEVHRRVSGAKQREKELLADREHLRIQEQRALDDRRSLADVNQRKKKLKAEKDQAHEVSEFLDGIEGKLTEVRDQFLLLERCPCYDSTQVQRQEDASIMRCQCGSEWGRRGCATCGRDYAFIVPYYDELDTTPQRVDPVRLFGADMCASLLPPVSVPFQVCATECPWCLPISTSK